MRAARFSSAAAVLLVGCVSGTKPAIFETARAEEPERRTPPGVVMDPSTELPSRRRASSSERQLLVLEAPPDVGVARRIVAAFFRAVTAESITELSELLDSRAHLWNGQQQSRRESLQSAWAKRLGQLDYSALSGHVIYRDSDIETYRASEAVALRDSRGLPSGARSEEVLVRVPIVAPTSGNNRLFGDELVFLLRPAEDGYKIGEIFEDFRLP